MKRLFSFLLIALLSFSLLLGLASCTGAGNGALKTTVSEAEWNAAFEASNVTASGYVTERDRQESLLMQITSDAIFTENDGYTSLVIKKDGNWHSVREGVLSSQMNGVSASISFLMRSFRLPSYESFTYDEQTKSYRYVKSEGSSGFYQFDVYFENGVITKIEGREDIGEVTHFFEFKDYGSTVVEVPSGLR